MPSSKTPARIGAAEAKRLMDQEGYVYLDVRSVPEFEQGHPNGAYNVPLMHFGAGGMEANPDFVAAVARAFSKDQRLLIGCKSGGRSKRAAEILVAAGFTNVIDQCGGYGGARGAFGQVTEAGWHAEGLPTATEAASGRSWDDLAD